MTQVSYLKLNALVNTKKLNRTKPDQFMGHLTSKTLFFGQKLRNLLRNLRPQIVSWDENWAIFNTKIEKVSASRSTIPYHSYNFNKTNK